MVTPEAVKLADEAVAAELDPKKSWKQSPVLPTSWPSIEETRPTSLERRELEIAETLLIEGLVGADSRSGDNPYWGYLEYVHEHPKIGRDLERRAPAFFGWVRKKAGR